MFGKLKLPKSTVVSVFGHDVLAVRTSYPSAVGPAAAYACAAFVVALAKPLLAQAGEALKGEVLRRVAPRISTK